MPCAQSATQRAIPRNPTNCRRARRPSERQTARILRQRRGLRGRCCARRGRRPSDGGDEHEGEPQSEKNQPSRRIARARVAGPRTAVGAATSAPAGSPPSYPAIASNASGDVPGWHRGSRARRIRRVSAPSAAARRRRRTGNWDPIAVRVNVRTASITHRLATAGARSARPRCSDCSTGSSSDRTAS